MSASEEFMGLTMPVFTAFGWAGEETAIQYALAQLETFISRLHGQLSREAQAMFPHYGLDKESRSIYLAATAEPEKGPFITFNVRPNMFEIRLSLTDEQLLAKGWPLIEQNSPEWHRQLWQLGVEWVLHIQQLQVDVETGTAVNYQDLFRDSVTALSLANCETHTSRANFLQQDERWRVYCHLMRRYPADQAAIMGVKILPVMSQEVDKLLGVVDMFQRAPGTKTRGKAKTTRTREAATKVSKTVPTTAVIDDSPILTESDTRFSYTTTLKPIHLRKGFINLTAAHWPFFARNARESTRKVTLQYAGRQDKESAVWRLQPPQEIARLVLSDPAHNWLEKTFASDEEIHLFAARYEDGEIQISLEKQP